MNELVDILIRTITRGGVYAAVASGLGLVLGVSRILNVAHGPLLMGGMLVSWWAVSVLGLPVLLALLISGLAMVPVGLAIERGVIRKVAGKAEEVGLLALFGVMVMLESAQIILATTDFKTLRMGSLGEAVRPLGTPITLAQAVGGGIGLGIIALLHFWLTRTDAGRAVRAVASNREATPLVGISPRRLDALVYVIGALCAGLGGGLLAWISPFAPQDQIRWLAWAFLMVVVGGLGSSARTALGAMFVALAETTIGRYLPFQFVYIIIYLLLAGALSFKGTGLGGRKERVL